MFKRIVLLVFAVLLSLSASVPVFGAEKGEGVIEGVLVNKTPGGKDVANVSMTLKIYMNDAETGTASANTDAGGKFIFNNLITTSNYSYAITFTYQEADYDNGERITFSAGETKKTAEIPVWDSTTSDAAIKVANAHTIISLEEDGVRVKEYFMFSNEGDRTYIGTGKEDDTRTLRFTVPDDASDIQYGGAFMQCCAVVDKGAVADSMDIFPGTREMFFDYKITPKSGKYALNQTMFYPIDNYNLIVPSGSVQVSNDKLALTEPFDIKGTKYDNYAASGISRGEALLTRLSNLPASGGPGATLKWLGLAMVALAGSFGIVYSLKRRQQQPQAVAVGGNSVARKQKLLTDIASLDDAFESGKIEEGYYRELRAAKKQELVSLMQKTKR